MPCSQGAASGQQTASGQLPGGLWNGRGGARRGVQGGETPDSPVRAGWVRQGGGGEGRGEAEGLAPAAPPSRGAARCAPQRAAAQRSWLRWQRRRRRPALQAPLVVRTGCPGSRLHLGAPARGDGAGHHGGIMHPHAPGPSLLALSVLIPTYTIHTFLVVAYYAVCVITCATPQTGFAVATALLFPEWGCPCCGPAVLVRLLARYAAVRGVCASSC